jgi:Zn finger protein HypA/HybF involved in hydrogenase expression
MPCKNDKNSEMVECKNCGQESERTTIEYNGGCPFCGLIGYVNEWDIVNERTKALIE